MAVRDVRAIGTEVVRLIRTRGAEEHATVRSAVTIRKPCDDVRRAWSEALPRLIPGAVLEEARPDGATTWRTRSEDGLESVGSARFSPAPGDRGTEVLAEIRYVPTGGAVGQTVAKILGRDPGALLYDELRRFKQELEVGEVVTSGAEPPAVGLASYVKQRVAQPPGSNGGDGP